MTIAAARIGTMAVFAHGFVALFPARGVKAAAQRYHRTTIVSMGFVEQIDQRRLFSLCRQNLWDRIGNGPAKACESIQHRSTALQFSALAVKVTCHEALLKKFETAHSSLSQATSVVSALLPRYCAPQSVRCPQHLIAGLHSRGCEVSRNSFMPTLCYAAPR
jgi:hypothetical protein